jgi:cholesterol oxidase
MTLKGFHYGVIVIGSGFGGSLAALRATEKGYKVSALEPGKRWPDADLPPTSWTCASSSDVKRRLTVVRIGDKLHAVDDFAPVNSLNLGGRWE